MINKLETLKKHIRKKSTNAYINNSQIDLLTAKSTFNFNYFHIYQIAKPIQQGDAIKRN